MVEARVSLRKNKLLSVHTFTENNLIILAITAIVLFGIFSMTSASFLSAYNIKTFFINLSFFVIVAAGETLVLITGNLDISIGGVIALTSVLAAKLYEMGVNIYFVMFLCLMVGVVTGILNGWLVNKMKLVSLIVTLGTSAITSGLAFVISNGLTIAIMEDVLGFIGRGTIFHIPTPILLMVSIVTIFSVLLHRTKLGLRIYASGANSRAAYLSGIHTDRIKFVLYIVCGLCASIGGLVITSLSAVGMPRHGIGQELAIITAVLMGGVPLSGGKGSVIGTLVGMFIMHLIYNGLTQLNVLPYYIQIIQGFLLIVIVSAYVRSEMISKEVANG